MYERFRPFRISNFTGSLTIEADPMVGATIGQRLDLDFPTGEPDPPLVEVDCDTDRSTLFRRASTVLEINNSPNVRLEGGFLPAPVEGDPDVLAQPLNIVGGQGISLNNSEVRFEGVMVMDSLTNGVRVGGAIGSSLSVRGPGNEIAHSCSHGVTVGRGSLGAFRDDASIHDNHRFGLTAIESGRVTLTDQVQVADNFIGGVLSRFGGFVTVFGEATIQGNATNPDPADFFFQYRAGIAANFGSTLLIRGPIDPTTGDATGPGPTIDNNLAPGILIDANSTAELTNLTGQGNIDGGVIALHQAVVQFGKGVALSGNGPGDLDCDQTSTIYGDLGGVMQNKCNNAEPDKNK